MSRKFHQVCYSSQTFHYSSTTQKKTFLRKHKLGHEQLDTEEGESNKEGEEFTTSSETSEQDSESDTTANDTEASEPTQTFQTQCFL